ncbi:MAG: hypothetical protein PHS46_08050 [Candidatus Omnitrophica bacterium]|nr:hypothetical protein [Candidatus Omnitrophota bacterium]
MPEYGWTSYRKTGWVLPSGTKEYYGCFRKDIGTDECIKVTVRFFASKPTAAMREIAEMLSNGGRPQDINGAHIN